MQAFFAERLIVQRQASPHTIAAYRDTFRLLLACTHQQTDIKPHALDIEHLDVQTVTAFLDDLEQERGNTPRTRNARLAGIRSLYHYAALRHPEHAATIARVLAIPTKRHDRAIVTYLTEKETAALLAAPNQTRWIGRRDHALMTLTIQTGLRVSELTALRSQDAHLARAPHIQASGKGRKQRITPLTTHTTDVLRRWTQERAGRPDQPLFATSRGRALSRDAIALLVARHATTASRNCPILATKTVSPHVLRHTAAMNLLHAGVDTSVIALWLGHESTDATQIYLHAEIAIKERALARTTPTGITPGRYRPTDTLLAFLEQL
jgi:integrase/recombinase XerD